MSLPTYAQLSVVTGVTICHGILPSGQYCHGGNLETNNHGAIHWDDRKPTRAGIRRFLTLAGMILNRESFGWRRIYRAQVMVNDWSRQVGVRYPAEVTDEYRSWLKDQLYRVPPYERDTEWKRARTWTQVRKSR